jgi:acyl carrier protein
LGGIAVDELFKVASKILAEQMNIDQSDISLETTFEEIEADSIDIVEMIMALEDLYDVEFPEEDLEDYPTMGALLSALYEFLQQIKK